MAFGIDDALAAGLKIVDKFIPDPEARIKAAQALRTDLMAWDGAQNKVNEAEAANSSIFVSGWRPAIGWICAGSLLYTYILVPFSVYTFSFVLQQPVPKFPVLDDHLWELMFGLLGMGGLRTLEKLRAK